ncbi:MAG: hypothetical protein RBS07_15755 [Lentimicrobium sp.]|jgi:hypothetical protein|nr:hypothetical protein [Lentimicrobium sp.]
MLNKEILKNSIKQAFEQEQTNTEDANLAADRIADRIADAVIAQIKSLTITYTAGLTSPSGPVTGVFNCTLS